VAETGARTRNVIGGDEAAVTAAPDAGMNVAPNVCVPGVVGRSVIEAVRTALAARTRAVVRSSAGCAAGARSTGAPRLLVPSRNWILPSADKGDTLAVKVMAAPAGWLPVGETDSTTVTAEPGPAVADTNGVGLLVGCALGDFDGDGDADGLGDDDFEGDGLGEGLGDGDFDGDGLGDGDFEGDGLGDDGLAEGDGDELGDTLAEGEGLGDGLGDGERLAEGAGEGLGVALTEAVAEGPGVGLADADGDALAVALGDALVVGLAAAEEVADGEALGLAGEGLAAGVGAAPIV
jgi:hypothetical protein